MSSTRASRHQLTRRRFLALAGATAGAAGLPWPLRLRAAQAYYAASFSFDAHARAVLLAAANTVIPAATVHTRVAASLAVPAAGDAGTVDYIENLLSGVLIYAAGTRRPPYVAMPPGVDAPLFPAAGATPMWTAKRAGWFGEPPRPGRPEPWPSELTRLQGLYIDGIAALDAAVPGGDFSAPTAAALREPAMRQLQGQEAGAYDGQGEGNQPFFMTFLDHVAEACFGDPVYGGNRDYAYWDMINFSGPSYIDGGGPRPGQGWSAEDMTAGFDRTKAPAT